MLGDGALAASMAKTGGSSAATTGGLSPFAAGGLSLTAQSCRRQPACRARLAPRYGRGGRRD